MHQGQPVCSPVAQFLHKLICVLIYVLVYHLLFELVELRKPPFELLFRFLLIGDPLKSHAYFALTVLLEIEKSVGVLQLVQIALNVLVIVDILHKLSSPLTTLLIVHELFTVEVVKKYADL